MDFPADASGATLATTGNAVRHGRCHLVLRPWLLWCLLFGMSPAAGLASQPERLQRVDRDAAVLSVAFAGQSIVWVEQSRHDALTLHAVLPGRQRRPMTATFATPADADDVDFFNSSVEVVGDNAGIALWRRLDGVDNRERGSQFFMGSELWMGQPASLVRVAGCVRDSPQCRVECNRAGLERADDMIVTHLRPYPGARCDHAEQVEIRSLRTGSVAYLQPPEKLSRVRAAGRFLAWQPGRTARRKIAPITVFDLHARRVAYQTRPIATPASDFALQADGKLVAALSGRSSDWTSRPLAVFSRARPAGRLLNVRVGRSRPFTLAGDRVVMLRGDRRHVDLVSFDLRGTRRTVARSTGTRQLRAFAFDGEHVAWAEKRREEGAIVVARLDSY